MKISMNGLEISQLRKSGTRVISSSMVFHFLRPSSENQKLKVGFSLRRQIGPSVVRSRMKRVFREALQKKIGNQGLWVLISPRGGKKWESCRPITFEWSQQECQVLVNALRDNPA